MSREYSVRIEPWPLRRPFVLSRGAKTAAEVVVVEVLERDAAGRGECVPYARYGESPGQVRDQLEDLRDDVLAGLNRQDLQARLGPGAARNALDCAFWDLEAKRLGKRVHELADLPVPLFCRTAMTVSLGPPEEMAADAEALASLCGEDVLLKLKLDGEAIEERVAAVRRAAPNARLILDANEAWSMETLLKVAANLAALGAELIEQPLPDGADDGLASIDCPVPLLADESCHGPDDLARLKGRYDLVNVKLDKTGGFTGALDLIAAAEAAGFGIMLGSMVGTSLGAAPALMLAGRARYVDLDGPFLLADDRDPGLAQSGDRLGAPDPVLWG